MRITWQARISSTTRMAVNEVSRPFDSEDILISGAAILKASMAISGYTWKDILEYGVRAIENEIGLSKDNQDG